MKKILIVLPLLAMPAVGAASWQVQVQNVQKLQPGNRQSGSGNRQNAPRRNDVRDVMLYFYVTQFQKQAQVSDEVNNKIVPFMQEFVQNRLEISQRRTRALNQIRQAINRGAGDEELTRLAHEVDAADAETQSNQEKFLANVDPLLTPKQQARLRVFQQNADNQIRQYLNTVQGANRGQPQ
jgi:hypothetical protein